MMDMVIIAKPTTASRSPLRSRSSVKKYAAKQNMAKIRRMVIGIHSLPEVLFFDKTGFVAHNLYQFEYSNFFSVIIYFIPFVGPVAA
jgi:hypothetical protein